jgi:hypothetical protein
VEAAKARGDSDSTPDVRSTVNPSASASAAASNADLPTPGSPCSTSAAPREWRAWSNRSRTTTRSSSRPASTRRA